MLKSPGFNYKFNALSGDPENSELMKAFSKLFKGGQKLSAIPVLKAMYPPLRFLVRIGIFISTFHDLIELQPERNEAVVREAGIVMNRIGTGLLKQSKSDKSSTRKDILSVLAQANSMEEKVHQMSERDVLSRAYKFILDWFLYLYILTSEIPTFIVAGHETTR
jgi:hypothetical protein